MARRAKPKDIDQLCLALPEVERTAAWGELPAYQVRGKSFVIFRGPRADAVDPGTGQRLTDVIIFRCSRDDKVALVEDPGNPFFTTAHFDGYDAVLLREAHVGRIGIDELSELITDAWLKMAPKRLAKEFLAAHQDQ